SFSTSATTKEDYTTERPSSAGRGAVAGAGTVTTGATASWAGGATCGAVVVVVLVVLISDEDNSSLTRRLTHSRQGSFGKGESLASCGSSNIPLDSISTGGLLSTVGAMAVPTQNSMKMIDTDENAERQRRTQPPSKPERAKVGAFAKLTQTAGGLDQA
ncbi:MAG: hypothetical protein ACR2ME_07895, partial [Acidimicrobiia bacterium]